ncbi:MAG: hypothetical protein JWM46_813 [Candidatus Kaiserbacteria bacterium]|nr:hypothetical protein [Candidatus Kaiserbacteria bacterium]
MNKNIWTVVGIIIVILIGLFLYVSYGNNATTGTNATSTVTTTDTGGTGTTGTVTGPGTVAAAPVATTNVTAAPTDTTAVVTGTVNPRGAITAYWYEFGTTPNLGKSTARQSVGSGYSAIPSPGYMTGLTKSTTYYYRLVAQNSYGQSSGETRTLTTTNGTPAPVGSIPTVRTLAANALTSSSANVAGTVDPNQASTQYWFEYGTSANLGNTTAFVSAGSGNASLNASASLSNLSAGTTYYYRLNAQNQFGTVNGSILTFKTNGAPSAGVPVVTTQVPSAVATTTATLNGTVNPSGAQTTYWFEYSTDSLLGALLLKTTPHRSTGAGQNTNAVSADVANLASNTTYYVQLVAQNSQGTVRGAKESFQTK